MTPRCVAGAGEHVAEMRPPDYNAKQKAETLTSAGSEAHADQFRQCSNKVEVTTSDPIALISSVLCIAG